MTTNGFNGPSIPFALLESIVPLDGACMTALDYSEATRCVSWVTRERKSVPGTLIND